MALNQLTNDILPHANLATSSGLSTTVLETSNPSNVPAAETAAIESVRYNIDKRSYLMTRVNGVHILPFTDFDKINEQSINDCLKFATANQINRIVIADTLPNNSIVSLCRGLTAAGIEVIYIDHHIEDYLGNPNKRHLEVNHQRLMTMDGVDVRSCSRQEAPSVSVLMDEGSLVDNKVGMYICCPPDLDSILSGLRGCGLDVSRLCEDPNVEADTIQMLGRLDSPNAVQRNNKQEAAWLEYFGDCLSLPQSQAEWADLIKSFAGAIKEAGLFDDNKEGPFTREIFEKSNLAMDRVNVLTALIINAVTDAGSSIFQKFGQNPKILVQNPKLFGATPDEQHVYLVNFLIRNNINTQPLNNEKLLTESKKLISSQANDRSWTRVELVKALDKRLERSRPTQSIDLKSYVFARTLISRTKISCEIYTTGRYHLGSRSGDGGVNFKDIENKSGIRCGGIIGRQGIFSVELPLEAEARKEAIKKYSQSFEALLKHVSDRVAEIDRRAKR